MELTLSTQAKPEQITEACGSAVLTWADMVRVYETMQRHLMAHLCKYDLTTAQYDVLAQLSQKPGITQQALAEDLIVTKANITGIIDRMSARGLVERRCDPDDRRSNLLYLTAEGERLANEAVPAFGEFVREHMSGISSGQMSSLREILRALEDSLHEH